MTIPLPAPRLLAALLLALAPTAHALDVPLDAAAIALSRRGDEERLLFGARDAALPAPAPGSAGDPTQPGDDAGAFVEIVAEGDSVGGAFVVPRGTPASRRAPGWRTRQGGYRFSHRGAPAAPSEVALLTVRPRARLRLVAKAIGLALDGAVGRVSVRITMGDVRYCARFDPATAPRAHDAVGRYVVRRAVAGLPDCTDATLGIVCDPRVRNVPVPDLRAPFGLVRHQVLPQDIDAATSDFRGAAHEIFIPDDPSIRRRDQIVVVLPGTNNVARNFTQILRIAARAGYPAIGLVYDTAKPPHECDALGLPDAARIACRTTFVTEKLYGIPGPNLIDIDEPNSIAGRLFRLLQFLHAEYPTIGFDRHYDAAGVRWEGVVVSGFSQGSLMAGYLAKDHPTARAVLLAGGCDASEGPPLELMPWCFAPRATPAERTFALMHVADEPEEDLAFYQAYGLLALGGIGDAAAGAPSYCTRPHVLRTNLPSQGTQPDDHGQKAHLSVAHDGYMPLDDGVPVLAEDYYYLFTAG